MTYRYLKEGEFIQEGDEYNDEGDWTPAVLSGYRVKKSWFPKYRRAITMKYDILKPVSVESVTDVYQRAGEKLALWILGNGYSVGFGTILVETTIKAMPDNFRAWLVEHGFIRIVKEFEPFDIRVETAEECIDMFCRYNQDKKLVSYRILKEIKSQHEKLEADE